MTARQDLHQQLTAPAKAGAESKSTAEESGLRKAGETEVEGYRMEKMKSPDEESRITSSGVEWLAGLLVLCIIGLALYGAKRASRLS